MTLLDAVRIARRFWITIAACILVGIGVAAAYAASQPRLYTASSEAYVTVGSGDAGISETSVGSSVAAQKASADGGTAAPAVDAATGTVASAKGTVSSATSSAARTAGSVTAAAVRGIQANPVAAVLIAFGAGWLIAALLPSPGRSSGRRPG